MKTSIIHAVAVATLSLNLQAAELPEVSPTEAGLSPSALSMVDAFMNTQVERDRIAGGVVIISHGGKIGFFNAYGSRDLEAGKPMTKDTIFRIYSMTKAITTAAALMLHDEGAIGLDDAVAKYIPGFGELKVATPEGLRSPRRPVTVKDLMLHTSGFSYGSGPEATREAFGREQPMGAATLEEMMDRLSRVPLAFDPGTDWLYGVSTDVLGRVVEVASGESLDAYFRNHIFEPLDMPDTSFHVPAEKLDRFAANYRRGDDGLEVIDAPATSRYAKPATQFSGGGGLVSTARDYMRFLSMIERGGELDGKRILKPETVKLMRTNQLPDAAFPIYFGDDKRHGTGFGLGFSVRTEITSWDPSGHVGEYGWGGAASTHYWLSPADDLIVVTLEQIMPYQWDTEFGLKELIYEAIEK